jgi:hypothetical protein
MYLAKQNDHRRNDPYKYYLSKFSGKENPKTPTEGE